MFWACSVWPRAELGVQGVRARMSPVSSVHWTCPATAMRDDMLCNSLLAFELCLSVDPDTGLVEGLPLSRKPPARSNKGRLETSGGAWHVHGLPLGMNCEANERKDHCRSGRVQLPG